MYAATIMTSLHCIGECIFKESSALSTERDIYCSIYFFHHGFLCLWMDQERIHRNVVVSGSSDHFGTASGILQLVSISWPMRFCFYWPGNIHVCSQTYVCSNKFLSPFFHLITNSEEKALTSFEKFCVWVGVMEKPTPCPGIEDFHSVSSEKNTSTRW